MLHGLFYAKSRNFNAVALKRVPDISVMQIMERKNGQVQRELTGKAIKPSLFISFLRCILTSRKPYYLQLTIVNFKF